MRAVLLVGASLGLCTTVVAQPQDDTVQWGAQLTTAEALAPGGAADIAIVGVIKEGWHVYGLEQLPGGPTSLRVALADSTVASVAGAPSGSKPRKVHDKRFNLDTQLYSGTVSVQLPVRVVSTAAAGTQQLAVNVRFQSCSEQECRPPRTVHLSVPVEVSLHE
jgi:hypothetical protein